MADESNWYGPDAATFGDRVAAAREQAGLTQGALAKRLGVRLATLRGWEDDLSEPRANRLATLAGVLNVSMMWLMTGEGEGVSAPEENGSLPADLAGLLGELRSLRTEMHRYAEAVGRLEKRVRKMAEEQANV